MRDRRAPRVMSWSRHLCEDLLLSRKAPKSDQSNTPLLALESLNRHTFRFSRLRRACCVKKRLAPSTIYLKWGLPSESTSAATFETLTASGLANISRYKVQELARGRVSHRPPQGTKRSALKRKCAPFRKSVPSRTISPAVRKEERVNSTERVESNVPYTEA